MENPSQNSSTPILRMFSNAIAGYLFSVANASELNNRSIHPAIGFIATLKKDNGILPGFQNGNRGVVRSERDDPIVIHGKTNRDVNCNEMAENYAVRRNRTERLDNIPAPCLEPLIKI